ncbi:protein SpAN-like [Asterias amurensis]|uniref:protein SpAN-like n=1 Tax=Asterias amurensis TaxID=7602 RepID=UPI003AB84566
MILAIMRGNLIFGLLVSCAFLELGCCSVTKLKNTKLHDVPDPVRAEPPEEKDDSIGTFQSDMLLSPEQLEEVMERIHEEQTGTYKRRAHSNLSYRWPQNVVPFEIDTSSEADRDAIQAGMDLWTARTCIQFVPYSDEVGRSLGHENRVRFIRGKGCYSNVGMMRRGAQTISIGSGCGVRGTVAHEIGHALGWHHEQSRPDRDDYVTINFDNVASGRNLNFYKYVTSSIATYDVPYDAGSIMHYGALYFSSNGLPTIVAVDPMNQFKLGNRNDFSFYDIKMANLMLECAAPCPKEAPLHCQNEGFIGKDCTCICKPGYIGELCQTFDEGSAECVYELTDQSGTLTSPNFPEPYGNYELCVWKIVGEEGSAVNLTFTSFDIERGPSCRYDKVIIRSDSDLTAASEQKFCGNEIPAEIESAGNVMLVVLSTDKSYTRPGFEAQYVIHSRDDVLVIPNTVTPTTPTLETTTVVETTKPMATTTVLDTTTVFDITTAPATTTGLDTTTVFDITTAPATTTGLDTTTVFDITTAPATTTGLDTTTVPTSTTDLDTTTVFETPFNGNCESVVGTCGGAFHGHGCIASPNYGKGNYNLNAKCVYTIKAPPGQRIKLTVLDLHIEYSMSCAYDYLEINHKDAHSAPMSMRLCGDNSGLESIVSTSNKLTIKLVSDGTVSKEGFVAKFEPINSN